MSDDPCVTIIGHGFTDQTTLEAWAQSYIQDYQVAIEVADNMLHFGNYQWNEDDAEFYQEFEVADVDEFKRQLVALKVEWGRVEA